MRKRIRYIIVLFLCLLEFACSDDEVENVLYLSASNLSFDYYGGEELLKVTATDSWTAVSDRDWCQLSANNGSGNMTLKLTILTNTTEKDRQANVVLKGSGCSAILEISQQREITSGITPAHLVFMAEASADTVSLLVNSAWTMTTSDDWIGLPVTKGEAGNLKIPVTVAEYMGETERQGLITVSVEGMEKPYTVSVLQYGVYGSAQMKDSLALAAIYSLLDPPDGEGFGLWDPQQPFSTWKGVKTSVIEGYTRVVSLSLATATDITENSTWPADSPFPDEIGLLDQLVELNLESTGIAGQVPAAIGKLIRLEKLNLSDNNFTGALPEEWAALKKLKVLNLRSNFLTGDLPEYIGEFTELQALYFGFNCFDRIPDCFGKLQNLTILEFPGLQKLDAFGGVDEEASRALQRTFPLSLLSLPALQKLNIRSCYFTGSLPEQIGKMSGLQTFIAYDNHFTGHLPATFSKISGLTALNLSENDLSGALPDDLANCGALQSLILSGNTFSGGFPGGGTGFRNLQTLELRGCGLEGRLPISLFTESHFISVDLSDNQFGGALPDGLGNQRNMTLFRANNNAFTSIPVGISGALALNVLELRGNAISILPESLGRLYNVGILDLRDNHIEGSIPEFLSGLTGLGFLGLSGNRFSGAVPQSLIDLGNRSGVPPTGSTATPIRGFTFGDNICPQQDGYGVTGCPEVENTGGNNDWNVAQPGDRPEVDEAMGV